MLMSFSALSLTHCTNMHVCTHIHACMHMHTHARMHTRTHACTHTHSLAHYTTHTHTHTHTHTQSTSSHPPLSPTPSASLVQSFSESFRTSNTKLSHDYLRKAPPYSTETLQFWEMVDKYVGVMYWFSTCRRTGFAIFCGLVIVNIHGSTPTTKTSPTIYNMYMTCTCNYTVSSV